MGVLVVLLRQVRQCFCGTDPTKPIHISSSLLRKLPRFAAFAPKAEFLGLSRRDVAQMLVVFRVFDRDHTGSIDMMEYLMGCNLDRGELAQKIFSDVMDADGSGEVDFKEFICGIWAFCTLTRRGLATFAFQCYSKDYAVGGARCVLEMRIEDCRFLMNATFGANSPRRAEVEKLLVRQFRNSLDGISLTAWLVWAHKHERALQPIFAMQTKLRQSILGEEFWTKLAKAREQRFGATGWIDIAGALDAVARDVKPVAAKRVSKRCCRCVCLFGRRPPPIVDAGKITADTLVEELKGSADAAAASARADADMALIDMDAKPTPKRPKKIIRDAGQRQKTIPIDSSNGVLTSLMNTRARPESQRRETAPFVKPLEKVRRHSAPFISLDRLPLEPVTPPTKQRRHSTTAVVTPVLPYDSPF
ncbi:hypothetical protein M885DRAFT_472322 [Pelagophyceae sp. CCMP2097]|nr:hypothetical protein M885DRAFT_472322 [Pelagophyceae sp. CCMP2097]